MQEIVVAGESYFDRDFIKFLVNKYKKKNFYFNEQEKYEGKTTLIKNFFKLVNWAKNIQKAEIEKYFIVAIDLDFDGDCVTSFLEKYDIETLHFSDNFLLTVQVREIESWILADPIGLSQWSRLPTARFQNIDQNFLVTEKPTKIFLNICSQNPALRKKLCDPNNSEKKGSYYNEELTDFVHTYFDPERARQKNQSLDRFLKKIETML